MLETSHVVKEFKLLCRNGFANGLKNSTVTGLKHLCSSGGIVLDQRDIIWKNEV